METWRKDRLALSMLPCIDEVLFNVKGEDEMEVF